VTLRQSDFRPNVGLMVWSTMNPSGKMSNGIMSVGQMSVGQMSVSQMSVDQMSIGKTFVS
jgi:hypothetical protein